MHILRVRQNAAGDGWGAQVLVLHNYYNEIGRALVALGCKQRRKGKPGKGPTMSLTATPSQITSRAATSSQIASQASAPQVAPSSLEVLRKNAKSDGEINWITASFMIAFHVGAVAALFFFSWKLLVLAIFLNWVATSLGIGICYHRLLTHRGYKAPKWVEYFLTICATLALEGGPIFWVATHRIHHQFSDQDGDPHSPLDGKWWSHMGWILMGKSMHHDTTTLARYVPDLAKDKFHVWITKYHYVPMIVLGLVLLAIGGIPAVLWGIFLRTVVGLHFTWLVNSATHSWGTRRYKTRDLSTNSWWVALVTWGEGWHNNHHAHPVSARHGLAWYEIDFNWYAIWIMNKIGMARQIYRAKLPSKNHDNEVVDVASAGPEAAPGLVSAQS
jgi:fatty-acid desaturase